MINIKRKIIISVVFALLVILSAGCQQNDKDVGALNDTKIIRAEEWKNQHPDIYASFMTNAEMKETKYGGSVPDDYLEEYPNLKVFYDGYGFSKEYLGARGHIYALEDVINTSRPKGGASCLACKAADFNVQLANEGEGVNKIPFNEFVEANPEMEGISCYDCHRNTPGEVNITRTHLTQGLTFVEEEKSGNLACAQCHVEYYLAPDTNKIILPWHNGIDTDNMIEYYDEINFRDYEHPTTGAQILKAQHPEFETFKGSIHDAQGLTCIDCHMPRIAGEENLKSHQWTSPLKSKEGLTKSCIPCHGGEPEDIISKVEGVQESVYKKTNEVSDELLTFINRLGKAVEDGDLPDEVLEQLRGIHRNSQFKWDFVFVENSEGFHNSQKTHKNLDNARELITEGIEILEEHGK